MTDLRRCLTALACLLLASCKIAISVPEGGSVQATSGSYACGARDTCTIDVSDTSFDQTFVAWPEPGYRFVGWRGDNAGLCGGSTEPCRLRAPGTLGTPQLLPLLDSDLTFQLEPLFELAAGGPLYLVRYCEVLLANLEDGKLQARVFGTQGLNDCPGLQWAALDPAEIAAQTGSLAVAMNGPRYWVLDRITRYDPLPGKGPNGEPAPLTRFGGLETRLLATVEPPPGALAGNSAYRVARVARDTIWHYVAGRRVYELRDPDGRRFVMQSFSQRVDPRLAVGDLTDLDTRLALPPGWTFSTRILDAPLDLATVNGSADVVTDDLANTYQLVP